MSETKNPTLIQHLKNLTDTYLALFPDEAARINCLLNEITSNSQLDLRSTMTGHVTGTAIVIKGDEILFLHHNILDRWLCPGGHFDLEDELMDITSLRELVEETGIDKKYLHLHTWHKKNNMSPIDIDIHTIPTNIKKNEGKHLHFDFRYVFNIDNDFTHQLQLDEVSNLKWLKVQDIDNSFSIFPAKEKLLKLL